MTDPRPDHAGLDELAAGYALGALEPDEASRFRGHASQCERCSQALADYQAVAAALAETALAASPDPGLKARVLAIAASTRQPAGDHVPVTTSQPASAESSGLDRGEPAGPARGAPGQPLAPVIPLRSRAESRRLKIAAAAAAVVIAGAGIWGGLAAAGRPPAATAGCVAASQCTQVVLTAAGGHHAVAGRVIIEGRTVWLRPDRMRADDTASEIYVLWQLTGKHFPLAVGSFDVRPGAHGAIKIGTLAASYRGTLAFAVSLEHGRTIPASPSQPVALGQVPAPAGNGPPRN